MADRVIYWGSVVLSALALVLLIINVAMIKSNQTLQMEIGQRQATINNAVNLSQLDQALAQALAQAAVANNNSDIRDLLAAQGITVKKPESAAGKEDDASKKK